MAFSFEEKELSGVYCVKSERFSDHRGYFMETFRNSDFREICSKNFVQVNFSRSRKGVLRGLHYQKEPNAQAKFVTVMSGEIFDVAVDLRKGSPAFGKYLGMTLNEDNRAMLYIPEGFAHGFCVLSENADVLYYCTAEYSPEDETGVRWDDPKLAIEWPVPEPVLSDRDKNLPLLESAEINYFYEGFTK